MTKEEGKKYRILIVDDVKENIQLLGEQLRQEGYKIAAANNAQTAFDIVKKISPDLILLDVMMPGLNGFEICERLKQNQKTQDIPIIFLTAKTDIESITLGFEAGAVDYLTKPFHRAELSSRVKTHIKLKNSYEELKKTNEKLQGEDRLKAIIQEKEVLLREVHHRVKNNLQIISSLLGMQAKNIENEDFCALIEESQNRIKSIALIHEKLYQSKNLAQIDFAEYIKELIHELLTAYAIDPNQIHSKVTLEKIFLSIDTAIPCAMIINEIVSNSLKYAFPEERKGKIEIHLEEREKKYFLRVSDDGIGLPKGYDPQKQKSLGMKLIRIFTEQLEGKLEFSSKLGTKYQLEFPIDPYFFPRESEL